MSAQPPVIIASRILDAERNPQADDNQDVSNYPLSHEFIMVVQIDEEKGPWNAAYSLYWEDKTDSDGFARIASTGEIAWGTDTDLTNGTDVTSKACQASGGSGSSWQDGEEVEGDHTCDAINLQDEYYTEIHFALNGSAAEVGHTYHFGLYDETNSAEVGAILSAEISFYNDPPAVVLNTADAYETSDNTPTLEFTGTDPQDNDVRYRIQIDTANTFDSQSGSGTVDSYSESNQDSNVNLTDASTPVGQSFVTTSAATLTSVKLYLKKSGSPSGNAIVELYAHSGTYGTSSVPTGSVLATSDNFDISTLTTSYQLIEFTFSGAEQYSLGADTYYTLVLQMPVGGVDSSNYVVLGTDTSSPSHGGNYFYTVPIVGWTAASGTDACFYVIGDTATPLIDAISGTDAGFTNTTDGTDTDPFDSGDKCDYTVQSALSLDTYYWRVKGSDPTGGNTWGDWATTRSFTVISAGPTVGQLSTVAEGNVGQFATVASASIDQVAGVSV